MKASVLSDPDFVGRERELAELTRYLDLAFEGKGTAVFISGEAGSGKTRLIKEFLGIAKEKNVALLSTWCLSDVAVPYLPFIQAFDAYFSVKGSEDKSSGLRDSGVQAESTKDEEAEIKAWLAGPKQAGRFEKYQNLTAQAWQDLTVAAVTKALLSMSARKAVVLFIDDLHWADSASLSLLHYISRFISSARVLVLSAYRSEELVPDADGRPHPLLETLRLMKREDLIREIRLPSLDPPNVAVLAEKMVGGSVHSELAETIAAESQGNPLFIVESLRMLSEDGSLFEDRGQWRLSTYEVRLPSKIKDIILRRVGMLKPSQRRILDLASVIGDKFEVELLSAALGQDSLQVLETLNDMGQASSLVSFEGDFYRFDHAKSRDAVYEEIPPLLRRRYHARIAETLEDRSKGAVTLPVNDLAYHYSLAGIKEKAVRYSLDAGEDALQRFSNAEAAKHYRHVLTTVSEAAEYSDERTAALEGVGDALSASGLFVEALKAYEELFSVAESGAVKLRALRKAHFCSYWRGDRTRCHKIEAKSEEYSEYDRLEYARLRLYRGFLAGAEGRIREAVEDEEWALKVFEEEYSLRDVAAALAERVFSPRWGVPAESIIGAGLRSVAIYQELEDLRGQVLAYHRLGGVLGRAGLFPEGKDAVDKSLRIGEQVGEYNFTALSLWGRSTGLELTNAREALAVSLKAVEYAEKTSAYYTQYLCYCNLVKEYALLGEIERAEESIKEAEKLLHEASKTGHNFDAAEAGAIGRLSKTYIMEAKGQWKDLADAMAEFVEVDRDKDFAPLIYLAHDRKRYARALEKQGRIEEAKIRLEEASTIEEEARLAVSTLRSRLEHSVIHPYLMMRKEIGVGEETNIRLDLVNVGRTHAKLIRVEGLIPQGFKANFLPSYCSVQNDSIELNGKELASLAVETLNLNLQATKPGDFTMNPQVTYVNDAGKTKTCKPQPIAVKVHPILHSKIGEETVTVPILSGRITTGSPEIDTLLLGGIPENYAVLLASPSIDEKALLVSKFLMAGAEAGETTFHVTTEAGNAKALAEKYPSNFYLVLCNPRAESMIQNLPNVFRLKGVENLTEIDIALVKAFRGVDSSRAVPKRICIEIVSDVLLQHGALVTKRWLMELLPTLKENGLTVLAVVNPRMHPSEDFEALLDLFDGEVRVTERETREGMKHFLKIRKLRNQKYLEKEIVLSKEKLS